MATKKPSAAQIAARKKFSDIMKAGGFKKNPLTRVKKSSPSMATGKAPSTRLKKRRAKTAKAPAGYYANPAKWRFEKAKGDVGVKSFKYSDDQKAYIYFGTFRSQAEAKRMYKEEIDNLYNELTENPTILITDTPKKRTVIRRVNPVAKSVRGKSVLEFPFVIEIKRPEDGSAILPFEYHAGFKTKGEATNFANILADQYPKCTVRVKSYKSYK
jgi:hypothetical protein